MTVKVIIDSLAKRAMMQKAIGAHTAKAAMITLATLEEQEKEDTIQEDIIEETAKAATTLTVITGVRQRVGR